MAVPLAFAKELGTGHSSTAEADAELSQHPLQGALRLQSCHGTVHTACWGWGTYGHAQIQWRPAEPPQKHVTVGAPKGRHGRPSCLCRAAQTLPSKRVRQQAVESVPSKADTP
jgi:hypothetical protein